MTHADRRARALDPARILSRLRSKIIVDEATGCWIWNGQIHPDGYGQSSVAGKGGWAHRIMFELIVGPIPTGMTTDHRCHTDDLTCPGGPTCPHRRCVNPEHLELVTRGENTRRGQARITHCPHGHAYDEANTYRGAGGKRSCRTCHRERERARSRSRRAAA